MDKNNQRKKEIIKKIYIIGTLIVAFASSSMLWYWNVGPYWTEGYRGYATLISIGVLFCVVYWCLARMYRAWKIGVSRLTEITFSQILSFGMADAVLFVETIMWFHGFWGIRVGAYVVCYLLQVGFSVVIAFVLNRLYASYDSPRVIYIIYGENPKPLISRIQTEEYRYHLAGCIRDNESLETLIEAVNRSESTYLYEVDDRVKKELILYSDRAGKEIYITQDIPELIEMGFDVSHTFDIPFVRTRRSSVQWYYPFVKRCLDIFISMMLLVILLPVFAVVGLMIRLYDHGPVFYKQLRLTQDHKAFYIYKFRSMVVNAERQGARLAAKHDDRITPVGRIIRTVRIDELPQLFNILKGDMSLVGPRPERPEIEKEYLTELPDFSLRLKVKAGLTGYAQVFGKYNTTPKNKLKLDLIYINQRSLLLDFKLLLYTVKILFKPESTEGIEDEKECRH